jgi:hypothetical protein
MMEGPVYVKARTSFLGTGLTGAIVSSCTVTVPAADWGTNILYVEAIDTAGNISQPTAYYFYAPWNPNTVITPGDVNGDAIPDVLATTADNLLLYPGNTDPGNTPVTGSPKAASPDGTAWSTYQVAHRGSVSQGTVDDLFAHKAGNLYVYANGGGQTNDQYDNTASITTIATRPSCSATADNSSNCSAYPTGNWSDVTQILAPGDAWNPTPGTAGSASASDNGQPSLLAVENGALWLYQVNTSRGLQNPVQLGSSGWGSVKIIAPGIVGGKLTIWAYNTTTGNMYSYPISLVSGVPSLSATGAPVTAGSGTAVFTYTVTSGTPVVASPGPLDNSSFPGLYIAVPGGTNPSGAVCAHDCLYYFPGQSSASAPLSQTPVFVGATSTAISQLS